MSQISSKLLNLADNLKNKLSRPPTLLIDMDCILVDMLPPWLKQYCELTGESLNTSDITDYDVMKFTKDPVLLEDLLHRRGFFRDLPPMPGAVKYFNALLEDGFDMVVLTQPPRKADFAINEKRDWLREYFPKYDLSNVIYAHRKTLVGGNVLFDDKPSNITGWAKEHPFGTTATIVYPYNKDVQVDLQLNDQKNAWEQFYEFCKKNF